MTHKVTDEEELIHLCQEHDANNGVYQVDETPKWESTAHIKKRVETVLNKYKNYDCVVVSGHAMMMQAVTDEVRAFEYGEIVPKMFFEGEDDE